MPEITAAVYTHDFEHGDGRLGPAPSALPNIGNSASGGTRGEHRANVVAGGDTGHAEQRLAVLHVAPAFERTAGIDVHNEKRW